VRDILRGAPPPRNAKAGRIAYKTGTSYGHRDAWSAGFRGGYTVAVWVGRADGTATPGLTGRGAAAPLLFDIFAMLDTESEAPHSPPKGVMHAETADLPMRLRYFDTRLRKASAGRKAAPPVRIAFPPDCAEMAVQQLPSGAAAPLPFKAEGGALPLTWLVDGRVQEASRGRRQLLWSPKTRGFVDVVVVDANGARDEVQARIR